VFPLLYPLAVMGSLALNLAITSREIQEIQATQFDEQHRRQMELEQSKVFTQAEMHLQTEKTKRLVVLVLLIVALVGYIYAFWSGDNQLPVWILNALLGGGSIVTFLWNPDKASH
jgi:hypothetical protein